MTEFRISRAVLVAFLALSAAGAAVAAVSNETALTAQARRMDALNSTQSAGVVSARISSDFSTFAGSTENADALVTGLRNATPVTLSTTDPNGMTSSTTFTPPTGKMGYGNVYISLALAKQQLAGLGITEPTAQQLQAALVGGTVTTSGGQATTLTGVLDLRAQGMGWGQIAQSYGYKLGPVISGMRASNANVSSSAHVTTGAGTASANASAHSSGIVSGAGATASAHGSANAYGRGIVTGAGTSIGGGTGNAYGRGIVTGGGAAAGVGESAAVQGRALGRGR